MEIFFGVLGGLGLFLYGMHVMSSSLQRAAGDKLKDIIGLLTTNRFLGVLVGAVVTAIVQSSSATTVMVVGFVNAGMMTLSQAVGVIMGANIGTTVTAQIISFRIDHYAPMIVGIAVMVWLVTKNRKTKQIAESLIGFGILFIGMSFMSDALRPLRELDAFAELIISFSTNPLLGILAGFFITVAVQSSTASTSIVLALSLQGLVPLDSALPVLFGINIGTTITAMISSIGASRTARRAAAAHVVFNIVGTLIFLIFLRVPLYNIVEHLSPNNVTRQIANAHTIFNITSTIMLLPFAGLIVKTAKKIVPGEEEEKEGIKYIDPRLLETPTIALNAAMRETLHMGNTAKKSLHCALRGFFNNQEKEINDCFRIEKIVNEIERELSGYLVKLSNTDISKKNREIVTGLFNTINDIERVGDHADNIAELAIYKLENNLHFTEEANDELDGMSQLTIEAYEKSLTAIQTLDQNLALEVLEIENKVDDLEKSLRANHIDRLNKNLCNTGSGVVFLDIISNLERISDHSSNIAYAAMDQIKLNTAKG